MIVFWIVLILLGVLFIFEAVELAIGS